MQRIIKPIKFTPGIPRNTEPGPLQTGAKLSFWRFLNPNGLIGAYVGLVHYIYETSILRPYPAKNQPRLCPKPNYLGGNCSLGLKIKYSEKSRQEKTIATCFIKIAHL